MTASNPPGNPTKEQPLVSHLLELRDRLLRMVIVVFVIFLCLFPFANTIYVYVAEPLMAHLPEGTSMIATEVASPFLTPFKLSLVAAVFISMPVILYQFWAFVAPGLYKHEKKLVTPLLISSVILFYTGMLFAYYVVFPLVFAFLTGTVPDGVAVMTDISRYLDFVLTLFFAFGIAFEVPIATILLVWMGMTTPAKLRTKRPYVIVGAFVFGMLLTPPDIISQTLLALPMLVLFEIGIIFSHGFVRKKEDIDDYAEEASPVVDPVGRTAATVAATASKSSSSSAETSTLTGSEISDDDPADESRFVPMTEEEMDAELDAIEAEDDAEPVAAPSAEDDADLDADDDDELDSDDDYDDSAEDEFIFDPVATKLQRIQTLRHAGNQNSLMRNLLYEVLEEGDEDQRMVAKNILTDLDTP